MDHARVDHAGCAPSSDATGLNGAILCAERSGWFLLLARGGRFRHSVVWYQKQLLGCLKLIRWCIAELPCRLFAQVDGIKSALIYSELGVSSALSMLEWRYLALVRIEERPLLSRTKKGDIRLCRRPQKLFISSKVWLFNAPAAFACVRAIVFAAGELRRC